MQTTSGAPTRLLDAVLDTWADNGWLLDDLHRFRMEAGDGSEGEGEEGFGEAGGEGDDSGAGDGSKTPEELLAAAQAEAEKWKGLARKHETQSKANATKAKEFDQLKASQMSDTEKAVEAAREEGRKAAAAELAQQVVGARIEAALTGLVPNPAEIVEDLNLTKYLTDTGEVDSEAITKLREKYETLAKPAKGGAPDLKQGSRGVSPAGQLTRADMAKMSPEEIVKAKAEGRLNDVLGIKSP